MDLVPVYTFWNLIQNVLRSSDSVFTNMAVADGRGD